MKTLDVTTSKIVAIAMKGDKFLFEDYQGDDYPNRAQTSYSLTDDLRMAAHFHVDTPSTGINDDKYCFDDEVRMVQVRITTTTEVLG